MCLLFTILTSIQVLLFGTIPFWTDLLGAGLILVTVMAITIEKNITNMMCGENDKEADEEQSGEYNQTYEEENIEDIIYPIPSSGNISAYGSTDFNRRNSLIPQEISQPNPSC